MSSSTIVPALRLLAVSGETLYPSEGGFSFAWGEVESANATLTGTLDRLLQAATIVTLRCGQLEVSGTLDRRELIASGCQYRIHIQSVRYGSGSNQTLVA